MIQMTCSDAETFRNITSITPNKPAVTEATDLISISEKPSVTEADDFFITVKIFKFVMKEYYKATG